MSGLPTYARTEYPESAPPDVIPPIAIGHLVRTLRIYAPAIGLFVAGITVLYVIGASVYYMTGTFEKITTLPFRLDFEGAAAGKYPNSGKFSPAEIVAVPILLRVYRNNKLERFMTVPEFSRAIFVLESNPALERLSAEYQSRLSDPKMTFVDRERIQKEFDLKRASFAKHGYAISYAHTVGGGLPEALAKKVLGDVLATWAETAVSEHRVLEYQVSMLSPRFMEASGEEVDAVVAVQILRLKMLRVLDNIHQLLELPAARLARSSAQGVTLAEVQARVEEMLRFQLEPLVLLAISSASLKNPSATVAFVETQLAHDQRALAAREAAAAAVREAILLYFVDESDARAFGDDRAAGDGRSAPDRPAVTTQLGDTFIDRLVSLTSNAADLEYRQHLIDEFRELSEEVIPLRSAVAYDMNVLAALRSTRGSAGTDAPVHAQIAAIRAEARILIGTLHQLHAAISSNLNPSTQLFTSTSPPYTKVHRQRNLPRLLQIGGVVTLAALFIGVLGALLHRRAGEEDAQERVRRATAS